MTISGYRRGMADSYFLTLDDRMVGWLCARGHCGSSPHLNSGARAPGSTRAQPSATGSIERSSSVKRLHRPSAVLWLSLAVFLNVQDVECASWKPAKLRSAISTGTALLDFSNCLDLAPPALLIPDDHCSESSPCWIATTTRLAMAGAPASVESNALLKTYGVNGKGGPLALPPDRVEKSLVYQNYPDLISDSILFVLWMIDPESYDFYYVREGRIIVVRPASVASANRVPFSSASSHGGPDDVYLPAGVARTDLGASVQTALKIALVIMHIPNRMKVLRHDKKGGCFVPAVSGSIPARVPISSARVVYKQVAQNVPLLCNR